MHARILAFNQCRQLAQVARLQVQVRLQRVFIAGCVQAPRHIAAKVPESVVAGAIRSCRCARKAQRQRARSFWINRNTRIHQV